MSEPIHAVCAWLGNSARVAGEHYLQVTEVHHEQAAQIPAQATAGRGCQRQTGFLAEKEESPSGQGLASEVNSCQDLRLPLVRK